MGAFFDFIASNFWLVIIIISGIIGFLNGDKEEQKKKQQRTTRPQQRQREQQREQRHQSKQRQERERRVERPVPNLPPSRAESPTESYNSPVKPKEQPVLTSRTIEAEYQAQPDQLKAKNDISRSGIRDRNVIGNQDLTFSESLMPIKDFSEEQEELRKNIRGSLRGKRLINGIIMAEVLGKPRSLKPYQSVIVERYKK